jgi:hypothetical protein
VAKDLDEVRLHPGGGAIAPAGLESRDADLVDQVAEEGCLRQDLDIKERRSRLERDGLELLAAMKAAGRVDILDRDRKDQPPGEPDDPAHQSGEPAILAGTEHMVAAVDRIEQGIEVGRAPGLEGVGDDHQGRNGLLEPPEHRLVPALIARHTRHHNDRAAAAADRQQRVE